MKSFLYEIPEGYLIGYRITAPYRLRVLHEYGEVKEICISPDLLRKLGIWAWVKIVNECEEKAKELWQEAKAGVDITPGDGCEHSDQMIID